MKEKGKQTQASLSSLCYTFYLFCASLSQVSSIVMVSVKDEYDNYLELITTQHPHESSITLGPGEMD